MLWVLTTEPDQSESACIEGEKKTKNTHTHTQEHKMLRPVQKKTLRTRHEPLCCTSFSPVPQKQKQLYPISLDHLFQMHLKWLGVKRAKLTE